MAYSKKNEIILIGETGLLSRAFKETLIMQKIPFKVIKISSLTGESGLSLSFYEPKKFDKEMCTKDESKIKKFGVLIDSNNCGNDDLAEIKYALDGN